jgi:hypothetical protein
VTSRITEKMFITAEDSMSPIAKVWVMLTTFSVKLEDGQIIPAAYVITTSTGYRAELPACWHDKYVPRNVCHRYHLETAELLRDRVAKTYRGR